MSIRSSIARSKDDKRPFNTKNYASLNLAYELIPADDFVKRTGEDLPKRLKAREYSVDHVESLIRIYNKGKDVITVNQLRDLFDDVGFNTDVTFSEVHGADIMMVYNIGGYLIPGWRWIAGLLYRRKPYFKNLYLTKLSPGIKRLHCRVSEYSDGSWYMTCHVDDANWMNFLNPIQAYKSHMQKGTGNYKLGTEIMKTVMDEVLKAFEREKGVFVNVQAVYENVDGK